MCGKKDGMMEEPSDTEQALFPTSVGEQLRAAREKAGLDLNDIATRTRIPLRHLEEIERGNLSALPSTTYAIGFVRSYARALGLPEQPLVDATRSEVGRPDPSDYQVQSYEPADPAHVPPRMLVWVALGLLALVLASYGIWRAKFYDGGNAPVTAESGALPEIPDANAAAAANGAAPAAAGAPINAAGAVTLTALQPVWLKVSDGENRLIMKEMAQGETFQVPATAQDPRILTGRPEALKVTIDGREVAPLGPPEHTVRNLPISAKALAARPATVATTPAGGNPASVANTSPANPAPANAPAATQ